MYFVREIKAAVTCTLLTKIILTEDFRSSIYKGYVLLLFLGAFVPLFSDQAAEEWTGNRGEREREGMTTTPASYRYHTLHCRVGMVTLKM